MVFCRDNISMIPRFFTNNIQDRIEFVEFIQNNSDVLEKILDNESRILNLEGEKFERSQVKLKPQSLTDILAFYEKRRKFEHVKTTYNYFIEMSLSDDPVIDELLYELDDDEIRDDGFMEYPERRKQIREFEEWLNTENVKKEIERELAKKILKRAINKERLDRLKENLDDLSVRPMGAFGEKDPGGLRYQKTLGEWEGRSMLLHDKKGGKRGKEGKRGKGTCRKLSKTKRCNTKKKKKKKKKKSRKTRRIKVDGYRI